MDVGARPLFPNYMERPRRLPIAAWHWLRAAVLIGVAGLIWLCFARPALALQLFWGLAVPALPLVFLLAPGLWRNLCPLAASNQLPRLLGLTRGLTLPPKLRRASVLIGLGLLFVLVPLRHVWFNNDARALAVLVLAAVTLALLGGLVFKGKSGWCGSFCPLLPVQRLYGQTPFAIVSNSHCQPCVGCTRNCYDFNPQVAWLADLYDDDIHLSSDRRLLAGMMPGLILAYFTQPAQFTLVELYLRFGLYCLVGIGAYWLAESALRIGAQKLTIAFAAVCLNLYYWFSAPMLFGTIDRLGGVPLPLEVLSWLLRAAVLGLSLWWIARTLRKEQRFLAHNLAQDPGTAVDPLVLSNRKAESAGKPVVLLEPGQKRLVAEQGTSLLALLEANDCQINAGCRMGACGADPVAVLQGGEALSPCGERERDTLRRLGYGEGVRLACSARVLGSTTVHLDPGMAAKQGGVASDIAIPPDLERIIVVGNGIAGVTAVDVIRRHWPDGELHLIGAERYPLYNRMAITKLIYGRTGMQGLLLMPERWYEERKVQTWLNTRVRRIDPAQRKVELATGEVLEYDRLILTAGSRAFVPEIANFALPGCYVLREAEDAMAIRAYVQAQDVRRAVVAGGGLLGLEAAYGLKQLGLRVTVLERSKHLLSRQLDAGAASKLHAYLSGLGLHLRYGVQAVAVEGEQRLRNVRLNDGSAEQAELLLVAAGIVPNIGLAGDAQIEVGRGVQVDDFMRSTQPDIYAAGDMAEWRGSAGQVPGLWTVAVEQGRIAASNALGAALVYAPKPQPTALKVAGVDLTSIGEFLARDGDEAIVHESEQRYRKLVLRDGKAVGAILLGHPELADGVVAAVSGAKDLSDALPALRSADWSALAE